MKVLFYRFNMMLRKELSPSLSALAAARFKCFAFSPGRGILLFMILSSLTSYCQIPEMNDPAKFPHQRNKWFVDSLNNKPIDFYLSHPEIDKYSKLFYKGDFSASDNDLTFAFLDSVLTTNPETKVFYLFVFNCVLRISDGALSEYMSQDCRLYFEKSPCDFLNIKSNNLYADNYEKWINMMAWAYYGGEEEIKTLNRSFGTVRRTVQKKCGNHLKELENIRLKAIKFIKENQ